MTFRRHIPLGITLALAGLCSGASAQVLASPPAPDAATAAPSAWIIGIGLEVNTYGNLPVYQPAVMVAGCWTGFCEISTLEMGSGAATVRQDVGYKLKSSADGSTMLIAIAGGSLTTATAGSTLIPTSVTLGGLGGGFAFRWDPGSVIKSLKGKGIGLLAEAREASVTSIGVKPQFAGWLTYRFK